MTAFSEGHEEGLCPTRNMPLGFGTRKALVPSGGKSEGLGSNRRGWGPKAVHCLDAKNLLVETRREHH